MSDNINTINLGAGQVFMSPISRDGEQGILLRPVSEQHEIGAKDPEWVAGVPKDLVPGDTVIWCKSLASARVLQDVVNALAMNLNGMKVIDT